MLGDEEIRESCKWCSFGRVLFLFQNEAKNLNDIYDILKSCEK